MNRNSGIVFLRLLATVGVIGDHIALCAIKQTKADVTPQLDFVYNALAMSCHWPVPIFMMITGCLLLKKENLNYKDIWKYVKRVAIVLLMFGFVFSMMEQYFVSHTVSLNGIIAALVNVLEGHTWEHMWYLYVLLGIYFILPVIQKAASPHHNYSLMIFASLVMTFTSLIPSFGVEFGIKFPVSSVYVGYVCFGYLMYVFIDKLKSFKGRNVLFMLLLLLSFALVAMAEYQKYVCGNELAIDITGYSSIVIVVQSMVIFNLVMTNNNLFNRLSGSWLIKRFDRCSFGIYIIHMLWINIALKVLHIDIVQYDNLLYVPVGIVVVFVLSWLSAEVMLKIPILKKYL